MTLRHLLVAGAIAWWLVGCNGQRVLDYKQCSWECLRQRSDDPTPCLEKCREGRPS